MLTMWWRFKRVPKHMNTYQFKKWCYFNVPRESNVLMRTLGLGPECAQELMDIVKFSKENNMSTSIVERVLNIKFDIDPDKRIAVYDWHTLAIEGDSAQFDIVRRED